MLPHLHALPDGALEGEEEARDLVAEDADQGAGLLVDLREEAAREQVAARHGLVVPGRAEHARAADVLALTDLRGCLEHGDRAAHAGEGRLDPVEVVPGQAVAEHAHLRVLVPGLGRLDAAEDHVAAAEPADLVLGLGAGALTDREHRDDARHPEQHAEGREEAPQLVQEQARDAQAERPEERAPPHEALSARLS